MTTSASPHLDSPDVPTWLYLRFLREAHAQGNPISLSPDESWLLQEIAVRWLDNNPMSVHEAINLGHLGSPATLHKRLSRLRSMKLLAIGQRDCDRRTKYLVATQQSLSYFKTLGMAMQKTLELRAELAPAA